MGQLLLMMLQRSSLIILLAYILMTLWPFSNLMGKRRTFKSQLILIVIFSIFAILGTVMGVVVDEQGISDQIAFGPLPSDASLANTRVLAISVSGLVGGRWVGLIVGLIVGTFRYLQGGTAPYIYFYSSLIIGIFSGLFGQSALNRKKFPEPFLGAIFAAAMEVIQMVVIVLLSDNYEEGWALVQVVWWPMVISNSLGAGLFLSMIRMMEKQNLNTRAGQTADVLEIVNQTLPSLDHGLNKGSALKIAQVIYNYLDVSAVSVTDDEKILGYVGEEAELYPVGSPIQTRLSQKSLEEGVTYVSTTPYELSIPDSTFYFAAAIVVPLKNESQVSGLVKLYFKDAKKLTDVEVNLAEGLANIYSLQLQLNDSRLQRSLLQDAELKSLQSQVNPHFFFNAINTISAIMRFDSEQARHLLLSLSDYFRSNLNASRSILISLEEEFGHVGAYLQIEEARFPGRVKVEFDIDEEVLSALVPPFILQVLIENALRHAFKGKAEANQKVAVKVKRNNGSLTLSVHDNGQGVSVDLLPRLGKEPIESAEGTGTALENLNSRLIGLFSKDSQLVIQSSEQGTHISTTIPIIIKEKEG